METTAGVFFGKFLKLHVDNIRSYSLFTPAKGIIFSTYGPDDSLVGELTAIATSAKNVYEYGIRFGHWYTDKRICSLQTFEVFKSQVTKQGTKATCQNVEVFVLTTAEATMAPHSLEMRGILFANLMRALLKPRDFPSEMDMRVYSLSINQDIIRKYVLRMDRLLDSYPCLLSGAVPINPGISLTTRITNTTLIQANTSCIPTVPSTQLYEYPSISPLAAAEKTNSVISILPFLTESGDALTEVFTKNEILKYTTSIVMRGPSVVHMAPLLKCYEDNPESPIEPMDVIMLGILNCIGISHNIITENHGDVLKELTRSMLPKRIFDLCNLKANTEDDTGMYVNLSPEERYEKYVEEQLMDRKAENTPIMMLTENGEKILRDDVAGEVYDYFIADSDSEADDSMYKTMNTKWNQKNKDKSKDSNNNSSNSENLIIKDDKIENDENTEKSLIKNDNDKYTKIDFSEENEEKVAMFDNKEYRFEETRYLARKKMPFTPRKNPITMYLYLTYKKQRVLHSITIVPLQIMNENGETNTNSITEHISVIYITPMIWTLSDSPYSISFNKEFGSNDSLQSSRLSLLVSDAILQYINPQLKMIFDQIINNAMLSFGLGEKIFSLRYLLTTSPGLVYFETINRTRHTTISPDLNPNEYIREHFAINNKQLQLKNNGSANLVIKQKLYNTLCKQIHKIQLAAHDVHAMAAKALSEGFTFYYERDGKYLRVYWLLCFYDKNLDFPIEIKYPYGYPESNNKANVYGKPKIESSKRDDEKIDETIAISGNSSISMNIAAASAPDVVKRVAIGLTPTQKGENNVNSDQKIQNLKNNDKSIETEYPGIYPVPLSRAEAISLNRTEEIEMFIESGKSNVTNNHVAYAYYKECRDGGYVCTPQYYESMRDKIEGNLKKITELYKTKTGFYIKDKKLCMNVLEKEQNSILCEVFGVFLNVVNIEDARAMMWKNMRDMILQSFGQ